MKKTYQQQQQESHKNWPIVARQTNPVTVRTIIGSSAYACIVGDGYSMDVRLDPGRGAPQSLRETAAEYREKAARLIRDAERIEQAALMLDPT